MSEEEKPVDPQTEEQPAVQTADTADTNNTTEAAESTQTQMSVGARDMLAELRAHDRITMKDVLHHVGGPIISIVLHVIILVLLATLFVPEPAAKVDNREVEIKMTEETPTPPPEEPEEPEELPQQTEIIQSDIVHDFVNPTDRPVMRTESISVPQVDTSAPVTASMDDVVIAAPPVAEMSNAKLQLKGLYSSRSSEGRKAALQKFGGGGITTGDTEAAVVRALRWFTDVQNEDGTWGDENDLLNQKRTLTCLVLLAYLAHGENTLSPDYGPAIEKGLKKVVEWANRNEGDEYGRARIGIVLSEGYAITRIPKLEKAMDKVIGRFVKDQNEAGGWRNWFNSQKKLAVYYSDLNQSSRIYNAIYSAYAAGCKVPGLERCVEKCIDAMKRRHFTVDGGFCFTDLERIRQDGHPEWVKNEKANYEATCAGVLFLSLLDTSSCDQVKRGQTWIKNFIVPSMIKKRVDKKTGKEREIKPKNAYLIMDFNHLPTQTSALAWYYETQALFQAGKGESREWKQWNASFARTLVKEQKRIKKDGKDLGYWLCPADTYPKTEERVVDKKKYTVDKVYNESELGGFSSLNAKVWSTAYFTLSLEVYYRYLPTFKPQKGMNETEEENEDDLSL